MRKTLLVMVLAVALMLLLVPAAALADNGPHGGYTGTNTPDGCAACHRAHTAQGKMLLKSADEEALCMSCHGSQALGADTNVQDGVYTNRVAGTEGTVGGGLRAGGFENTVMNTDYSLTTGSHAVVSGHTMGATGTVWGYGAISTTANPGPAAGSAAALECTSCHNPHGNSGPNGAPTYRILRSAPIVYGTASPAPTTTAYVEDLGITASASPKSYTVAGKSEGVANNYFYNGFDGLEIPGVSGFYAVKGKTQTTMTLAQQITGMCAQCHTRYAAVSGSYAIDSTDGLYKFRHAAHMTSSVTCLTCHVSHGSSASSSAMADAASLAKDGAMLRLDNRGVCANCHAAEWVYGVVSGTTAWSGAASDTTTVYTIAGTNLANTNAAKELLANGRVRLVNGGTTQYGVVVSWSTTQVQFKVPSGITAGTWNVIIIPDGCRDSAARLPRWPNNSFTGPRNTWTQGWGTLTLN